MGGKRMLRLIYLLLFFKITFGTDLNKDINIESTDIANEPDNRLLLFSTLDGSLIAIEKQTGQTLWKVKDKPVVQVPSDTKEAIIPLFLPDPRDGSLYLLSQSQEPLKKLPFTIPQLVASSPCRSSDGILYTGKKKDSWFMLDPKTGKRQQILGWDSSPTCPVQTPEAIYLGKTQYIIMMVDTQNINKKWNITFYEYSATPMSKEMLNNYEFVHFASSSTGRVVAMNRRSGTFLWDRDLGSPLVAAYILDPDGLLSAPFTIMSNYTLSHLAIHLLTHQQPFHLQPSHMKLYPTLYIGEHSSGLYAIPSFVDQNLVTISASEAGPLLLQGPGSLDTPRPYPEYPIPGQNYPIPAGTHSKDPLTFQSMPGTNYTVVVIGHYEMPAFTDSRLIAGRQTSNIKLISYENDGKTLKEDNDEVKIKQFASAAIQTDDLQLIDDNVTLENEENIFSVTYEGLKLWINQQENKGLKLCLIILSGCVVAMFWYLQMQVKEFQQSQSGSKSSQNNSFGKNGPVTAVTEELPDGLVRIGKIIFHPEQLLGKGCEGTFVYRGEFDTRKVAVKRLLPECFTFADREVALLRESDAHPNVIRYYCTEQDRMFRYIALELCEATLHDYVQGNCNTTRITPIEILKQATSGLTHLHSLDIVHRDIKPQNVLLSAPNANGEVRAMISDFGLCKKLQVGRVSFSRRSGITGTDGWIAPEMLKGNERTTYAVDLFSLGCLFYYVLSEGKHPFGDALRRQANILINESNLNELKGETYSIAVRKPLIEALISPNPNERPSCKAVLAHPIFWNQSTILAFLQDVSDRVEKAELGDSVLNSLETNGINVVQRDWRLQIDEEIAKDLRKYRTYRGESVRDLLRALRNKKHHYRELTPEARELLGEIPDNFTNYWMTRFPLLLIHSWLSMQCVANEPNFVHYYSNSHRYPLSNFLSDMDSTYEVDAYSPTALDIFNKKSDKKRDYYANTRSPHRNRKPNREPNNIRTQATHVQERVGLYRNVAPNKITEDVQKDVDINSINVSLINNKGNQERYFTQKQGTKSKNAKKSDEPLTWMLPNVENKCD